MSCGNRFGAFGARRKITEVDHWSLQSREVLAEEITPGSSRLISLRCRRGVWGDMGRGLEDRSSNRMFCFRCGEDG